MSEQTARRLSWLNAALSAVMAASGLLLSLLALAASGGQIGPAPHHFFNPVITLTFSIVGALVASRHPRNPIGWMLCTIGFVSALSLLGLGYWMYGQSVATHYSLPGVVLIRWLINWLWIPEIGITLTFLLLLFPAGRLPSPRWRPVAWLAGLALVGSTLAGMIVPIDTASSVDAQAEVEALLTLLLGVSILGSVASLVVRFRRSRGTERAQLKWLVYAVGVTMTLNVVGYGVLGAVWQNHPPMIVEEIGIILSGAMIVAVVSAVGIAIVRYRLYDIDILINRTLVYGSLTALIVGLYVLIVGSAGALLQTGGSLPVSLFATGIVAMSFQPLRERLQRAVNRLMFGERDDPYAVLGRLSGRLEVVVAAQSVLPTIVETVAEALKLPYTAIALKEGQQYSIAAEHVRSSTFARKPDGEMEILPLVYQLETIGQLILAPRAPGEPFSQTDRRLLETIARQAGIAAYNVRLTQDLQRSRERLVTTREEERRRLRRDLHDGLGPVLASMSFKLDAIHNLIENDPQTAHDTVADLKSQVQTALADIRRIAYDLRPPALDELGLVGALKEHITAYNQSGDLQMVLKAPQNIPQLRAAVEVAAYRIAMEAMTNVARHAHAHHCEVRLSLEDGLCLEIGDDGQGIPAGIRAGVGLASMRERAEELGGTCVVETRPERGTRVLVQLPC